MTIEVRIENKDQSRSIEVLEISIDKKTGLRTEGVPEVVKPGFTTLKHVYLLRDILICEVNPR